MARLVDIVLGWVFAALVASPWILAAVLSEETNTAVVVAGVIFGPLAVAAWFLYEPIFMARKGERNGQTPGKQVVSIRVVPEAGGPLPFGTGVVRDTVAKNILGTATGGLFSLVDFLWPLWDDRSQALHDKMANTLVVRA